MTGSTLIIALVTVISVLMLYWLAKSLNRYIDRQLSEIPLALVETLKLD